MTKEELEGYLAEGLSLKQIGERVGLEKSTVSYHCKKHGLKPVNQGRNANKGGIPASVLEGMVEQGLSLAEMAKRLERSVATVRYWLGKHGLWPTAGSRRWRESRAARQAGLQRAMLECRHHGRTEFILENRGAYRCLRCRAENVSAWRRRLKRRLLASAGGACVLCGYDKYPGALQFHHLEPAEKKFAIGSEGVTRSFEKVKAEAAKCVLLCANCHAEVEGGFAALRN